MKGRLFFLIACILVATMGKIGYVSADPGDLDPTFGDSGIVIVDVMDQSDFPKSPAITSDGKIVVVGSIEYMDDSDIFIMRFLQDGTPDSSFSEDGLVITDMGRTRNIPYSIALQPYGKIVVDGSVGDYAEQDILLLRYDSDGNLDPTFSDDGVVTLDIWGYYNVGRGVRVQPDGRIVAAAYANDGSQTDYVLARFDCDGSPDSSFSDDGIVTTDLFDGEGPTYLVLQPDGKIVVTGYTWDGNDHDWVTMRHEGGVLPDLTISPPSGKYISTQRFDLSLILQAEGLSIVRGSATLDGDDVTGLIVRNAVFGTLITGGRTIRVPNIPGSYFIPGCHRLSITLELSDGSSVSDTVVWEMKENSEP